MPEPTYEQLSAEFGKLLDEREEWRRIIRQQGAETEKLRADRDLWRDQRDGEAWERLTRDLAEAQAKLATVTAVAESNQRAHTYAVQEVQRLNAKLVAGHNGCEAEQQKLAMRDEWAAFERMRPVVEAAQAWREATKPHMPTAAGYEAEARLIIVVDAYDDYTGDIPGRCTRCGGLDGTHTIRNCAAALSPVDVLAQPAGTRFRLGGKVLTNFYKVTAEHPEGEPMGHACKPEDAQLIVNALNAQAAPEE